MSCDNSHGRPAFTELDTSWYQYMKADRSERKEMCEDMIAAEALAIGVFAVIGVIGLIIALVKGWI